MGELVITGLKADVGGREILHGIDLTVGPGEVHAVMGPNGSGKSTLSHVLMGKPGYEVTAGSVRLDGVDLLGMEPWQRAQEGLFLAMQYPIEVPGVSLVELLEEAFAASGRDRNEVAERVGAEAKEVGLDPRLIVRPLNVDLSGGEKKRNETVQLGVLRPKFAILDELDSGLDVDALRECSQRIEAFTHDTSGGDALGVLAITHYNRLLTELKPDVVHVLAGGLIRKTGGAELATELEETGYAEFAGVEEPAPANNGGLAADPFADPLS